MAKVLSKLDYHPYTKTASKWGFQLKTLKQRRNRLVILSRLTYNQTTIEYQNLAKATNVDFYNPSRQ